MRIIQAVVLAAVGISAVPAGAQDKSLMVGIATTTCDKMDQLLELDPEPGQRLFTGWLDGFLSGYNFAINQEVNKDNSVDLSTASFPDAGVRFQWLRSSCRQYPERPLWIHAVMLFSLIRKSQ